MRFPVSLSGWPIIWTLGFVFTGTCLGQGTTTITFEGLPRGVHGQQSLYTESGLQFGNITPQTDYLSGGGIPDFPDNGTGYLEIPAGTLRFGYNQFPPGSLRFFNLLSFDAAEWWVGGSQTLTVVGYKAQIMGSVLTVTNLFTLDGINDGTGPLQDFQTFTLDSTFQNIFRVDVFNASWSLDNVVISGVPEPSGCALLCIGTAIAAFHRRRAVHKSC